MNLCNQIKKYRNERGFSQKDLAEKIYVSTQTISNWENERSYPDIQNLLLLSVLFDVTLDDLVKGDVEKMKQEINVKKFNSWSWVMTVLMLVAPLSIAPSFKYLGFKGLIIPLMISALLMFVAIRVERLKKQFQLKTYSEILHFLDIQPINEEQNKNEHQNLLGLQGIYYILAIVVFLALLGLSFIVFFKLRRL